MSIIFNPKTILKKYHWQQWLQRPFKTFMIYMFNKSGMKKYFTKAGVPGMEFECWIFDRGFWYECDEVFEKNVPVLSRWLKRHSIIELTSNLDKLYYKEKALFLSYARDPKKDLLKRLKHFREVMRMVIAHIWLAHNLDYLFDKKLKVEVGKYIDQDKVEEFIRIATTPEKKTATELMDQAILSGMSHKKIVEKYGWIRSRDGFVDPYSEEDIKEYAVKVKPCPNKHKKIFIPVPLKKLIAETKELVYYRTQRTDIWIELIFLFRPVLNILAKKYNLKFDDLKYYTLDSFIIGWPHKYPNDYSFIGFPQKTYYFSQPLFEAMSYLDVKEIKGAIAQKGKVVGRVAIVNTVADLPKVKQGDVLVTFMTAPNFISAMRTASAFVTNEGGLTCHAAIVAREMKKPCVIGTKIATKVFKDGDFVEVDAENGIVRKI